MTSAVKMISLVETGIAQNTFKKAHDSDSSPEYYVKKQHPVAEVKRVLEKRFFFGRYRTVRVFILLKLQIVSGFDVLNNVTQSLKYEYIFSLYFPKYEQLLQNVSNFRTIFGIFWSNLQIMLCTMIG